MASRVPEGQLEARPEAVDRALARHARAPHRAPLPPVQLEAFAHIESFLHEHPGAWTLDAACGTGVSTHRLARRLRQPVVGVDRSADRLQRGRRAAEPELDPSAATLLVRADMPATWRLLAQSGHCAETCFLLYPNPSPKPSQMGRRWYAHPCFRDMLASCAGLELRTNWSIYAIEFAHALERLLDRPHTVEELTLSDAPLSPFEDKYHQSGHRLFRVRARTDAPGPLLPLRDHV